MTHYKNNFVGILFFLVLVLPAHEGVAEQTSIDSRITQAFENIDERTTAHEIDASTLRAKLKEVDAKMGIVALELEQLQNKPKTDENEMQQRMLQGQLTHLSAQYLNSAFKLVDSASNVISANLTDLAQLANQIRRSGRPKQDATSLSRRIKENVTAGRSMRQALVEMRRWAQTDPNLAPRFKSLRLIMAAHDRRITVDKARLRGRRKNRDGTVFDERLIAIDHTVDELSDMYTQLTAEKSALIELRDDVALAVQLGRLEMTRETVQRAVPKFVAKPSGESNVNTLSKVAERIGTVNDSLINQTSGLNRQKKNRPDSKEPESDLKIGAFENF